MAGGRTRVKICGVTRVRDARLACRLGADAVGVVFAPRSKRYVEPDRAAAIRESVAGFTSLVALFADPSESLVEAVISKVGPDMLQFHGSEPRSFCERFGLPYLKALPVETASTEGPRFESARALVVDSHSPGELGGTGATFDWDRFPRDIGRFVILAGGLNPNNVADAILQFRPYGVDVSSGVESEPGVKNPRLVHEFFEEINRADSFGSSERGQDHRIPG